MTTTQFVPAEAGRYYAEMTLTLQVKESDGTWNDWEDRLITLPIIMWRIDIESPADSAVGKPMVVLNHEIVEAERGHYCSFDWFSGLKPPEGTQTKVLPIVYSITDNYAD